MMAGPGARFSKVPELFFYGLPLSSSKSEASSSTTDKKLNWFPQVIAQFVDYAQF